jgi:hypothetical protein
MTGVMQLALGVEELASAPPALIARLDLLDEHDMARLDPDEVLARLGQRIADVRADLARYRAGGHRPGTIDVM